MKNTLPYLFIAGLGIACDKVEEVPCSSLDETFYAAQLDDLHDVDFQTVLNNGLIQANLDDELQAGDLASEGNNLDLVCATSITSAAHPGQFALAATDTNKGIIYIDVDSPDYVSNRDNFSIYLNEGDSYAYIDGVGGQLPATAHEFTHNLLPDVNHSDETQAFIASISTDNGMTPCEGWTFVANETDDSIYDVHAQVACAYEAFGPQKLEEL